jgi:hypothetical protein
MLFVLKRWKVKLLLDQSVIGRSTAVKEDSGFLYTVIRIVSISAKFSICIIVGRNVEAKIITWDS